MKIKYDMDTAYECGIRKIPRIQLENRGYKVIQQISETEFEVEDREINEIYINKMWFLSMKGEQNDL